jgi:periplasmic protein TonB
MYRSNLKARDKGGAIAAVIAIHAVLLVALLHMSGKMPIPGVQSALKLFNVEEPPPPPPPPREQRQAKRKQKQGAAAPANIKSSATPVKQLPVPVRLPAPPQLTTSPTPRTGTMPTQGSSVAGPGTGAGGNGIGSGSGSGGNGAGAGGDGGVAEPPHLATAVLSGRDFPRTLLGQWPGNATVFLRLRVDPQGYVSECAVDRGTGVASIDSTICDLARERLRFRPALNRAGQAVAGWFGYAQPAPR